MRNRLAILGVGGLILAALASPCRSAEPEWPTFRGPNHDGKSPDTGLLKQWPAGGPKLAWKVGDLGAGFSSVAVSGGMVYVTGITGGKLMVCAYDLDGKSKWKVDNGAAFTGGHPGARSSPTIDDGRLYVLSGVGVLGCFDAKTGKKLWAKKASDFGGRPGGWGYAESVLVTKDLAIFKPGGAQCVVALNKTTGEKVWASEGYNAGPEYSSVLPFTHAGKEMLVTGTKSGLLCLSPAGGAVLWSNPFCARNVANCPTPAYADGRIFWANGYGKGGICLTLDDAGKAAESWTTKDMVCHHGGYVIDNGFVYGNHEGGWACLDLKTGAKKWFEKAVGKGSVCWADGMLYLFGERGGQAALATCSPDGLEVKGTVTVAGSGPSWAHPVVIGGRLYLRYDTNLYCYDVRAPKTD